MLVYVIRLVCACLFSFLSGGTAYNRLLNQSLNQLARVTEYIQSDSFFLLESVFQFILFRFHERFIQFILF